MGVFFIFIADINHQRENCATTDVISLVFYIHTGLSCLSIYKYLSRKTMVH